MITMYSLGESVMHFSSTTLKPHTNALKNMPVFKYNIPGIHVDVVLRSTHLNVILHPLCQNQSKRRGPDSHERDKDA